MRLFIYIIVLSCIYSCNSENETWRKPNSKDESVLYIADSCLSVEQKQLKSTLQNLIIEKAEVVNNHLVLDVDKKYLDSVGVNQQYYKLVLEELDETSKLANDTAWTKGVVIDVNTMFKDYKNGYYESKAKK